MRHVDNGALQRLLAVVVGRVLGNVARQLGDLDFVFGQFALQAAKQHLALRRLEAVQQIGNGAVVVVLGKENVLAVDEFRVLQAVLRHFRVVQVNVFGAVEEPLLAVLDAVLAEDHVNEIRARFRHVGSKFHRVFIVRLDDILGQLAKGDLVRVEVGKVLLGFRTGRRTQPLVVLDRVAASAVSGRLQPLLVLGHREEGARIILALGHLDNRRNELLQKARDVQKRRPKGCATEEEELCVCEKEKEQVQRSHERAERQPHNKFKQCQQYVL